MERVFHDLHYRSATLALRYTSHRARSFIEHSALAAAVYAFCIVTVSHRTFVYRSGTEGAVAVGDDPYGGGGGGGGGILWGKKITGGAGGKKSLPTICLRSVPGLVAEADGELIPDVLHVVIGDDATVPSYSFAPPPSLNNDIVASGDERHHQVEGDGHLDETCLSLKKNDDDDDDECSPHFSRRNERDAGASRDGSSSSDDAAKAQQQPLRPLRDDDEQHEHEQPDHPIEYYDSRILYSYSLTKGLLLLPSEIRTKYKITTRYVVVSPTDTNCFGEPFLQQLVFGVVGPDTVALNWLLGLNDGRRKGYLFKPRTNDLIDLQRFASEYYFILPRSGVAGAAGGDTPDRISEHTKNVGDDDSDNGSEGGQQRRDTNNHNQQRWASRRRFFVFKVGVLLTSLFIFFVITNLVAFTLRETQDRMLAFTFQLRNYVRSDAPIRRLIFAHVVENLVFVPIMVGMIFFLIEFYGGDKFLAFTTLSVVWVCEVFSVISMRSVQGMQFFPRTFFLYFTLFHVYFFSCPFGFSYTSLVSTGLFLLHSMLFFINRFELPAILNGTVVAPPSPRTGTDTRGERRRGGGSGGRGTSDDAGGPGPSPRTPQLHVGDRSQHPQQQQPGGGNISSSSENLQIPDRGGNDSGRRRRSGDSDPNSIDEPLPSLPSMSSLGRAHLNNAADNDDDNDDDDDSSCLYFMNGEVVMQRGESNNTSSASLRTTESLSSTTTTTSTDRNHQNEKNVHHHHPEPASAPETPLAASPSSNNSSFDARPPGGGGGGKQQCSAASQQRLDHHDAAAISLTPQQSNVGGARCNVDERSSSETKKNTTSSDGIAMPTLVVGGASSSSSSSAGGLSCFDWDGLQLQAGKKNRQRGGHKMPKT